MDLVALVEEVFKRASAQDGDGFAAMFAKSARVKQNFGEEMDLATTLGWLHALWDAGISSTYENVRRVVGADAVVEQHDVRLTRRSDGLELVSDVCVVIRFDDAGLITRIDEYADPAPLQALAE
jgi:ketosteroid isomerase-like protein